MDPMDDVCKCGHTRRRHFAHGKPGEYDPCIAGFGEGGASICPCMGFEKADKPTSA